MLLFWCLWIILLYWSQHCMYSLMWRMLLKWKISEALLRYLPSWSPQLLPLHMEWISFSLEWHPQGHMIHSQKISAMLCCWSQLLPSLQQSLWPGFCRRGKNYKISGGDFISACPIPNKYFVLKPLLVFTLGEEVKPSFNGIFVVKFHKDFFVFNFWGFR